MNPGAETILEDRTLEEAADLLLSKRVNGISVVDGQGRLKGIIEMQDVLNVLIYVADYSENKTDFYSEYEPPMSERHIG